MNAQMKTALLIATVFLMSACASDSGSGSKSGAGGNDNTTAQQPATSTKLALKGNGSQTVLVGAKRDLRNYLVNYDSAEFKVFQGQSIAKWADAELPILSFEKAGVVQVKITDVNDQTQVVMKFKVTFDTAGSAHDPDIGHPPIHVPAPIN